MLSRNEWLSHYLAKPLVVGTITGLESMLLDGTNMMFVLPGGGRVPLSVWFGAVGALGSVIGEVAHDFILPHIAKDEKLRAAETAVLYPAVNAGIGLLAYNHAFQDTQYGQSNSSLKVAAMFGTAEVAGLYAFDYFVKPLSGL